MVSSLLSYILLYRYAALAVVVYVGAVGAPLPVNIMLLALGAFANQGFFSFWASLGITVAFNTFGDLTGYGITRKYGDAIIRLLHIRKAQFFINLEKELRSDAAITVFITRFAGSMSSVTNLLAGLVKVPFMTFFVNDLVANIIEPGMWLAIGYGVGNYWSSFSNLSSIVGGIFAVSIIMFILFRIQQRLARKYRVAEE
ncbi:MAG: VTT domain-containing protein [Candidatus Pacebacteria bacterium]|nr:VTT domain-containing protein [Candidatus Paceibacterota bacterium]